MPRRICPVTGWRPVPPARSSGKKLAKGMVGLRYTLVSGDGRSAVVYSGLWLPVERCLWRLCGYKPWIGTSAIAMTTGNNGVHGSRCISLTPVPMNIIYARNSLPAVERRVASAYENEAQAGIP